ncbi:PD-(D/E)XK nuclease domain-containing protein [Lacrimispora sp. 210928-DFI.3.58]|uniref:PD-(D/E)XK nuclease domain-containing protein n=1 Tax=Lacrimispora sp. 210928-DFI.3.58 TaxID=2883214 RepID=UPI0015B5545D|nr:PD-(D/E)XK nuclease domain-containing protein [Lacrimispora sp. 210928-DFI.3.58]MCB7319237.1 PD-(D/E)XK nuclease domain-containing protein [Lacrimispora sp. 210928-DFI.3.58]
MKFEYPGGKGYADCLLIPKKPGKPGIILELKYNDTAENALRQIKERIYVKAFPGYVKNVILVAINYDKKTKHHQCVMEKR